MEEQFQQEGEHKASGGIAKVIMGKVLSHKLLSERMLYWVLLATAFLLPVFFIPGQFVAPEYAKMILLEIAVLLGTAMWALGRLRDGSITLPKSMLLLVAALIAVQFVAAAFMSPAPLVSFIGSGYDIGTVNAFIMLFLLMFLSSLVYSDRDRILTLFAALLFSGAVAMLYHTLRHFMGASFLDFGVFTADVSTPVGKWNDLAALIGSLVLLALSFLYFFPANKRLRAPAIAVIVIGGLFLLSIDFTVLWMILFVMVGVLVALAVYEGEQEHRRLVRAAHESGGHHAGKPAHKRVVGHLPALASVLLVVAFIYSFPVSWESPQKHLSTITWGSANLSISSQVSKWLGAPAYSEVVLTPSYTADIVKGSLKESPLFGTGPNRFSSSFLMNKTSDLNRTAFWDSTFDFGTGRVITYFGTTGLIGMALWILFIIFLFRKSKKMFALFAKDRVVAFLGFTLFLLTIYFWSLAFFYLPNIAIFALAFIFTGALIGLLALEGVLGTLTVDVAGGSKFSAMLTPIVIIVLAGVVASGVLLYRQFSSLAAFRDAQLALNVGNAEQAETALMKASELVERDLYHRSLSNIALVKLGRLNSASLTQEQLAAQANQLIADARTHAERAIALDPTNFENYLQLGGVYDTLGSLGIQGTADLARASYQKALELNPKSPRVLFVSARLEFAAGNRSAAKNFLYQALNERPSFLEAIAFIVQLEVGDKNPDAALKTLQNGVVAEPGNFLLRFALGYMYYSAGQYEPARAELEAAVFLNPVYSDAKYFLGLTYTRLNRTSDAIAQFTDVQTLNPDNKDVSEILKNLKAGKDPFATGVVPPTQSVNDALGDLNNAGQ